MFRLYLTFQNPNFGSDDAYFNARIIETITETKTPFLYDELSYGGREFLFPQLFHYILSVFSFIPYFMKIIPEIFITSLTMLTYLIAKKLTKDEVVALITALLMSFSPALINTTLNQVSIYTIALPVMFLMFWALLDLNAKHVFSVFVVGSFVLPLLHPISFLFALALLFYLILSISESVKLDSLTKEAGIFSFFLIILINFIIYKKAFLSYGVNIIWQNIPIQLLIEQFQIPSVGDAMYLIGFIPLVLGSLGIFFGFSKEKKKESILLVSPLLTVLLLLLLGMININIGLLFLSVILILMASLSIEKIIKYVEITKLHKLKHLFIALGILVIVVLVVIPAFFSTTTIITPFEASTLEFLKTTTPEDTTIIAPVSQGHLITYLAKRKNVADTNFILAPNAEQRLTEIKTAYTTISESKALEIFRRYDVDYIFLSRQAQNQYNIRRPIYLDDGTCFKQKRSTVYEIVCK